MLKVAIALVILYVYATSNANISVENSADARFIKSLLDIKIGK